MVGIEVDAPAKVNLWLRVLAQETSGYHALETVFCALSLCDRLRVEEAADGVELSVQGGVDTGPVEDNLVVRAARRFYQGLGRAPAVRLTLHKRIPSAAGLGGGSSDAAAALRALNALHGDPVPAETLLQWGIELGSDVPFFLGDSPLALGWSRGERLLALPPLPSRPVLVAHPGVPMPTGGAFRRIAELRGGSFEPHARCLPLAGLQDWDALAALSHNDFQPVALERIPQLDAGLRALSQAGAQIALLAGSGASLFGVFRAPDELEPAETALRALGFATWRASTLERWPDPRPSAG